MSPGLGESSQRDKGLLLMWRNLKNYSDKQSKLEPMDGVLRKKGWGLAHNGLLMAKN